MSSEILVSVIVPVYNAELYLSRCLDSLVRQSLEDIEIILVNDGSSDGSQAIINQYACTDSRIVSIIQPNSGVSSARNAGIDAAKGRYIAFVDADDSLDVRMLQVMSELAVSSSADLALCGIDWQGEKCSEQLLLTGIQEGLIDPALIRCSLLKNIVHNRLMRAPWNKLFKRELIQTHRLRYSQEIEYGEDFLFNIDYLAHSKQICYCNHALYHYDTTTQGASTGHRRSLMLSGKLLFEHLLVLEKAWDIKAFSFRADSLGEYVFFARKQLRIYLDNSNNLSFPELKQQIHELVCDSGFKGTLLKHPMVALQVLLTKNITCKLIILSSLLNFSDLLLIKVWFNCISRTLVGGYTFNK